MSGPGDQRASPGREAMTPGANGHGRVWRAQQPPSSAVRVIVVDDAELSRRGLRYTIERNGLQVAGEADGSSLATELARRLNPHVAVVHLTSMSRRRIASLVPELAKLAEVLVIGMSTEKPSVLAPIEAGACGYVTRDASGPELVASILAASRGELLVLPRTPGMDLVRRAGSRRGARAATRRDLSERELQVLLRLVDGKGNVAIAEELFVSTSTVKKHVASILSKLGVENRVQAAVRAARWGVLDA